MYYETRDYPTHGEGYERGTREKANAGLALGIIGTVAGVGALLSRGGIGGLIGNGGGGTPANVNINGGGGWGAPSAFDAYAHECEAINYTDRKTCRMITGTVVVPTEPAITGIGSYCCNNQVAAAG